MHLPSGDLTEARPADLRGGRVTVGAPFVSIGAPKPRLLGWIVLSLLSLLTGCHSDQASGPHVVNTAWELKAATDTLTSGVVGGAPVVQPAVLATDKAGRPVARAWIRFSVVSGGGSVTPDSALSDAGGSVRANWTLGAKAGLQLLSASTGRNTSLTFRAVAAPGAPASIKATTGSEQIGVAGTVLEQPATVRVEDAFGNALPSLSVTFVLPPDDGSVSDTTALTDARGEARTFWKLSAVPGRYELRAVVSTLAPAVFLARAVEPLTPKHEQLTTGHYHTCSLGSGGRAYCWGDNYWGQLGATGFYRTEPALVLGGYSFIAIDAGGTHTCAIASDRSVYCWGNNRYGQATWSLDAPYLTTPHRVELPGETVEIAAGAAHSCALINDGAVYCWGDNFFGQLGDGTRTSSAVPVRALSGEAFASIDAEEGSTCALNHAGQAFCWGDNDYGQLGDGTPFSRSRPVRAAAGNRFRRISTSDHTCGITLEDQLLCWGNGATGALGHIAVIGGGWPVTPAIIGRVTALATGLGHTCAIEVGGTAYCWGRNWYGQVGDGSTRMRVAPVPVSTRAPVSNIAASWAHSCASLTDGYVECWGSNTSGQLGDGSGGPRSAPEAVLNIGPAKSLSVGALHSCGVEVQGTVRCWGFNEYERERYGTQSMKASQLAEILTASVRFETIALGVFHGCGLTNLGVAWCWGSNSGSPVGAGSWQQPSRVAEVAFYKNITAGTSSCAVTMTDDAYCWGSNGRGELGDGTTVPRVEPTRVFSDVGWATLSSGWYFTCGLTVDQIPYCWGYNGWGQLGDDSFESRHEPKPVDGGEAMLSIAAGWIAACGVATTSKIFCWGDNSFGQLGDGTFTRSPIPQPVKSSESFVSVTAGFYHFCGLTRDGAALCWGANNNGQLGLGYASSVVRTPQRVVGGHRFVALSAAGFVTARNTGTTCGLRVDRAVFCWGSNSGGQLGNGKAWSPAPVAVKRFPGS